MSQTDWNYPTSNLTTFFADASALARGTVCYLRAILQSVVTCNLVIAKSHVCTPGKYTIPRLEIEAALASVKLSIVAKQELDLCPIHRAPHGARGLTILDDETRCWLNNITASI